MEIPSTIVQVTDSLGSMEQSDSLIFIDKLESIFRELVKHLRVGLTNANPELNHVTYIRNSLNPYSNFQTPVQIQGPRVRLVVGSPRGPLETKGK